MEQRKTSACGPQAYLFVSCWDWLIAMIHPASLATWGADYDAAHTHPAALVDTKRDPVLVWAEKATNEMKHMKQTTMWWTLEPRAKICWIVWDRPRHRVRIGTLRRLSESERARLLCWMPLVGSDITFECPNS